MVTNFALFFWQPDGKIQLWSQSLAFLGKFFSLFENGQKKCPISNFPKNFPEKNLDSRPTCVGTFFDHFFQKS